MKTIVRWLSGFLIGMILPLAPLRGQVPADSFKVGVAPHTSARFILEQYQPLRTYLSKALGVEVEIVTAPDFTEFARQAVGQKYDIAITTGHQARMLHFERVLDDLHKVHHGKRNKATIAISRTIPTTHHIVFWPAGLTWPPNSRSTNWS